jgi:hypothetical protein
VWDSLVAHDSGLHRAGQVGPLHEEVANENMIDV